MKKCIDCKTAPRYIRPCDGKELERCYDCAKRWCEAFDNMLLHPRFIEAISNECRIK